MEVTELNAHIGKSLRQVPVSLSIQNAATEKTRHTVNELSHKLLQNWPLLPTIFLAFFLLLSSCVVFIWIEDSHQYTTSD